jgi:hypothetical protein
METLTRNPIVFKKSNSKFQNFFSKWKEGREESRKETEELVKTKKYQEAQNRLTEKNAKRGFISKV